MRARLFFGFKEVFMNSIGGLRMYALFGAVFYFLQLTLSVMLVSAMAIGEGLTNVGKGMTYLSRNEFIVPGLIFYGYDGQRILSFEIWLALVIVILYAACGAWLLVNARRKTA